MPPEPSRKRRVHRACDYCRAHRIKCVYTTEECVHCIEFNLICERIAPPPPDKRLRKSRLVLSEPDNDQGVEPGYLGVSSFTHLVGGLGISLETLDAEFDVFRGSVENQDGVLVGNMVSEVRRTPLITIDLAYEKLITAFGVESVLTSLYDTCSTRILPLFPVISISESLFPDVPSEGYWTKSHAVDWNQRSTPPTPLPRITRLLICALAAFSRDVPDEISRQLLPTVENLLQGPEFAKLAQSVSLASVQILTLLTLNEGFSSDASTWQRSGLAIRMALEIGLHRKVCANFVPLAQQNRRARVWAACICVDRWISVRRGQMMSIDEEMCDVLHPSHYPDHIAAPDSSHIPCFRFLAEYTKVSLLIGRTYRALSSPNGIKVDDLQLQLLETDIDMCWLNLPLAWPYISSFDTPAASSILNLSAVVLEFLLLRPFVFGSPPNHLTYRPLHRWPELVSRAKSAVEWCETCEGAFYLDVWSTTVYALCICLVVLVKSSETNPASVQYVKRATACVQAWARNPRDRSRRKLRDYTEFLSATAPSEIWDF